MPSLSLLSAGYGAVSQSSGRDVAFRPFGLLNLFPVFQCDMVVGTFFMSFLGGKLFLRKKSWCVRFQHCGYQATDKGKARKVSWYFWNSMLLCSRMFLFCVFHFWTTAVKKAGVLSFAWMLFHNFCCEWQILHLFGMKLHWLTTQICWFVAERLVCLLRKSGLLSQFIIRQVWQCAPPKLIML